MRTFLTKVNMGIIIPVIISIELRYKFNLQVRVDTRLTISD